jgi:hypothetical protein
MTVAQVLELLDVVVEEARGKGSMPAIPVVI